jgi:hypothetical protein
VAYDRYWSQTVVIDVRFSFYLDAILDLILFSFPLTPARYLVINLSISIGAAKMFAAPLFFKILYVCSTITMYFSRFANHMGDPPRTPPPPQMRAIGQPR